uniref:Uncharacterized protein n=1 Tax=Rhizophora mucronata TaxID=61149 RepID=A0A2P2NWQ2_RHIMU
MQRVQRFLLFSTTY